MKWSRWGALGRGGSGEAVGQTAAEGCGGEAQGWHGVRASCHAAGAARETASVCDITGTERGKPNLALHRNAVKIARKRAALLLACFRL